MLKELTAANIYIVCGHTDMRKSIDGLAAIVQQQFDLDLFSDSLFLFCGRRRDRLKALLWEGDGFLLFYSNRQPNPALHKPCITCYNNFGIKKPKE